MPSPSARPGPPQPLLAELLGPVIRSTRFLLTGMTPHRPATTAAQVFAALGQDHAPAPPLPLPALRLSRRRQPLPGALPPQAWGPAHGNRAVAQPAAPGPAPWRSPMLLVNAPPLGPARPRGYGPAGPACFAPALAGPRRQSLAQTPGRCGPACKGLGAKQVSVLRQSQVSTCRSPPGICGKQGTGTGAASWPGPHRLAGSQHPGGRGGP